MLLLIWTVALAAALILFCRQFYTQFSRKGVNNLMPVPLFGNMARITFRMEHFAEHMQRVYNAFPEDRFVGRYEFANKMIVIRDLELIKKITIKDFEHFLDHRMLFDKDYDPLFGRNLFALKGQEWKDMRSTLSPAFTSSKMRLMIPFMEEVGKHMITALKKKAAESPDGFIEVDCKDLATRYANDVIATCAFGLNVDSHTEQDNEFYRMGKEAATFNFKQLLMIFAFTSWPIIMKKMKFSLFSEATKHFFRSIVTNTMKEREEQKIIRPDMIHLLMEAKKGHLIHEEKTIDEDAGFATVEESAVGKKDINRVWSDDDLIAQAILFFIAGFETGSSGMSLIIYELATHPEIQERLAQEIREDYRKRGGKLDYSSIQELKYLDMVISESLRLWPPGIALDRICTKEYNLGKPNDKATKDYIMQNNDSIAIPVYAIHRDPNYFKDPLKFDPERFSEQNKHEIKPFTYMPFGYGPRNCVGSRFALSELKTLVYQLILHMEVSPCARTGIPAKLSAESFNLRLKGGHWLRMKVRDPVS